MCKQTNTTIRSWFIWCNFCSHTPHWMPRRTYWLETLSRLSQSHIGRAKFACQLNISDKGLHRKLFWWGSQWRKLRNANEIFNMTIFPPFQCKRSRTPALFPRFGTAQKVSELWSYGTESPASTRWMCCFQKLSEVRRIDPSLYRLHGNWCWCNWASCWKILIWNLYKSVVNVAQAKEGGFYAINISQPLIIFIGERWQQGFVWHTYRQAFQAKSIW